ncbi:hypothetical protein [Demequina litorisediminis]|uniref:Uncharacterized protein n=1 Tax=Demequina litorisediminis TaxID=1849022 RepID=A0ABQ6IDP8_9MICO|nr:hypothetical protein GCM10025876_20430 [Demequina litorisediminis]
MICATGNSMRGKFRDRTSDALPVIALAPSENDFEKNSKMKTPTTRNGMKATSPGRVERGRMMPKMVPYSAAFSSGRSTIQARPRRFSATVAWMRNFAREVAKARRRHISARYSPSGGRAPTRSRPASRAIAS